jgi:LacI family gluconate utilization system Gnt-I transcriptional repressor
MGRSRNTGIKEIGAALGISMMSVSRALRGVDGVSARTRADVLRMAKRLGYRPNRNARSLATANSTLIGVSVPTLFSDVFPEILDGMRTAFDRAGYDTVIDTSDYDPAREEIWVERMLDWNAAGVVLSGVDHMPVVRERLREVRIPTLEIWDVCDDPIDLCVGIDHAAAGLKLGAHLVAAGYRRPAFCGVPEGRDRRADKRLAGLVAAFAEVGTIGCAVERVDLRAGFQAGFVGTEALLRRPEGRPDVICYLNDHLAVGGIAACQRHGLSVPGDVGIAGFNDLEINTVLASTITTIVTPRRIMGEVGARNLVARINGVQVQRRTVLPVTLRSGGTTKGPRLMVSPHT